MRSGSPLFNIFRIEKEDIVHHRLNRPGIAFLFIALALGALAGCHLNSVSGPTVTTGLLYMTDTYTGKVWTYDPSSNTESSTSLVSTNQNSTGPIYFYNGIGYIAVGSYENTAPGVYYFNPSASVPTAVQVGTTSASAQSAQYIAFYSSTKAYVSVANYSGSASTQGVYTFNPSNPNAGLAGPIAGTSGSTMYLQGIVVGPDGMIYVANSSTELSGTDEVLQINPANNSVTVLSYTPSAPGTTALASGSYGTANGVFVGNISYNSVTYAPQGSIDFINTSTLKPSTGLETTAAAASIVYISNGNGSLLTTDTNDWYVYPNLSAGGTLSASYSGAGNAIAASTNNIYVSNAVYGGSPSSTISVYTTSGASTGTSIGPITGQCLANLAFH
jgi:hypothetical protein